MWADVIIGVGLGFAIDLAVGWPHWVYRRIGHPVGWFARPVMALEHRFNRPAYGNRRRFFAGAALSLTAIAVAAVVWGSLGWLVGQLPFAPLWLGLMFWPLIAARSMYDHVAAIQRPLAADDLAGARHAVSMIVGRNPDTLDPPAVARAALESLGENTSDGVIAPLFWGLLLGPAGMAGYKAINTLDSMIAHRNTRYEWFGKVAARVDDVANLVPARLTGLFYALASHPRIALRVMWRDARRHRSPNAGWPESALAAGVGVRLSGPRIYGDRVADEPWLNEGAPDPDATALARGLGIYKRVIGLTGTILAVLAVVAALSR